MKTRLFGTDGIRGEVDKYPLNQEALFSLGRTIGAWLKEQYPYPKSPLKVVVGKDTRESGERLELALVEGAKQEGIQILRLGTCPTPTVAYLTRALGAHLGAAISASHNPSADNGIKFFDANGYKLFPFAEKRIEEIFFGLSSRKKKLKLDLNFADSKAKEEVVDYLPLYLNFAKRSLEKLDLSGLKVVIDCAFGAFSKIAPKIFHELGAEVFAINNEPDGKNINVNCGTLYPEVIAEKILQFRADLGISFDGDGDRVIIADEKGNILDGDHILAILARYLLKQNRLAKKSIICTQMSNIGLELCLQRQGIRMIRTRVGDKYVLQEMLKHKISLGGEQSGHIIILERTTTGDGLIVALELIRIMLENKRRLSQLSKDLQKLPQVLVNVKVKEKRPFAQLSGFNETVKRCQTKLGKSGRLLVRYSGTEGLARVMVEGRRTAQVLRIANSVAKVIRDAIGENNEVRRKRRSHSYSSSGKKD